jgi:hypothetical protein
MDRMAVINRHSELKILRQPEEKIWRDIATMIRPEDRDFQGQKSSTRAYDEIFDSTPLYALSDFVGGLFTQSTSPDTRWQNLVVGDEDVMKWYPAQEWSDQISQRLARSFSTAVSSFYGEVPAWYADIGAFGLGGFYSEEIPGGQQINDRAIPLRQSYIDVDTFGKLDTFHREFTLSARQMLQRFGNIANLDERKSGDLTVIHAVTRNPDFQPGKAGNAGKPWVSVYCAPDVPDLHRVGGYFEMPYQVPMWNRRAGKTYPTGPGHIARADMYSLQEMERVHLIAGQFAAEPPLGVHVESDITKDDVQPGSLLYGAWSEQGKPMVGAINRSQSVQLSMAQSQQRREAIREAFYFSMMQIANRPQMTATEFLGFQEESLRRMGPNLVRLQIDGLSPLVSRRYAMLQRAGQLPPPPKELQGMPIAIEYVSPLAKMMKLSEGRSVLQWIGAVGQLGQLDPNVIDKIDADAAADVLHGAFGPPPSVLRSPDQVDGRRKARAQMQAQQAQLESAAQQVSILAEASHADQAQTLARGRAR